MQDAAKGVDYVVTMLPVGSNVKDVFLGDGVIGAADPGTVFIDSSTIDVDSSVAVHEEGRGFRDDRCAGLGWHDRADAATMTFMCGGEKAIFDSAADPRRHGQEYRLLRRTGAGTGREDLQQHGRGSIMLVTSEAFALGEKLGVDRAVLQDVISTSSGSSWIVQHGCPMPGAVAGSPRATNLSRVLWQN